MLLISKAKLLKGLSPLKKRMIIMSGKYKNFIWEVKDIRESKTHCSAYDYDMLYYHIPTQLGERKTLYTFSDADGITIQELAEAEINWLIRADQQRKQQKLK